MGPLVRTCAILALVAVAGCTTSRGSFCAISQPWRVSKETIQTMTEAQVKAALAHNRYGAKACGWKR